MSKTISPANLGEAIQKELTVYHGDVVKRLDEAGSAAVKKLVKLTKSTAPVGKRGSYKRHIASKEIKHSRGSTYVWYVRPPDHRLTHLLVHGHATKTGGRTKPDPFLKNAVDAVLPEYEEAVREAVKNDT